MTDQQIIYSTFAIERRLPAPPAAVFKAWSDLEAKMRWFSGHDDWRETAHAFDFRVGGEEREAGKWSDGKTSEFHALYRDIVPNERIVYVYDMYVNGEKISVSLATIEIFPDGGGARMQVTEQGAYFTGGKEAAKSREEGTNWLMDKLVASVGATEGSAK